MAVDSYGLPIEFYITGGEVHDSKAAPRLIDMRPRLEGMVVKCLENKYAIKMLFHLSQEIKTPR